MLVVVNTFPLVQSETLADIGVGVRIILKYTLTKWDVRAWTELIWLGSWTGGGGLL
jgi:hypothetical protein